MSPPGGRASQASRVIRSTLSGVVLTEIARSIIRSARASQSSPVIASSAASATASTAGASGSRSTCASGADSAVQAAIASSTVAARADPAPFLSTVTPPSVRSPTAKLLDRRDHGLAQRVVVRGVQHVLAVPRVREVGELDHGGRYGRRLQE